MTCVMLSAENLLKLSVEIFSYPNNICKIGFMPQHFVPKNFHAPSKSLPPRSRALIMTSPLLKTDVRSLRSQHPSLCCVKLFKQNWNFSPKDEGRSGRRPLLPKRKLNILVDLTLGKSYHSVVTFCMLRKLSAIRSQSRPHRN